MLRSPQEILSYWFGDENSNVAQMNEVGYIHSKMPLWFGRASPEFDAIQAQHADLIDQLSSYVSTGSMVSSDLNLIGDWDNPKGLLATIIVLDQFSRSVYRGTSKAFSFDHLVLSTAHRLLRISNIAVDGQIDNGAIDSDDDCGYRSFSAIERFFVIVAIQHSEALSAQELGVRLAGVLALEAPIDTQLYFRNLKGFPMEHHDVIVRFGRFPSRNDALVSDEVALTLHCMYMISLLMIRWLVRWLLIKYHSFTGYFNCFLCLYLGSIKYRRRNFMA